MASPVSALLGASNSGATAASQGSAATPPSEQMFLQLLVSQIQNQDPLNPVDSTQFVSQLSQFSELEQLIAIRGDMDKVSAGAAAAAAAVNTNPGTPTDPTSGSPAAPTNGTPATPTSSAGTPQA